MNYLKHFDCHPNNAIESKRYGISLAVSSNVFRSYISLFSPQFFVSIHESLLFVSCRWYLVVCRVFRARVYCAGISCFDMPSICQLSSEWVPGVTLGVKRGEEKYWLFFLPGRRLDDT